MTRFQTFILATASALTLTACEGMPSDGGQVASASDGRERVVVTANRREETIQDSAVAVTTITSENAYAPPPPPVVGMAAPKMVAQGGIIAQPMPGDVDRENYENLKINGVKVVAEEPVSTFSIDVDTASYSNVRRMLNAGYLPPKDAVRIEEMINYFDYGYDLPKSKATPFETTVKVVPDPWAEGKQLMHVAVQGYDIKADSRPPLNLTLLIDVSGSMSAQNKLPLAIQSLKLLINQMTERDHISIAVYAGAAGTVLEPTSGSDKQKIIAALEKLSAGGSTAGGEGLRLAYNLAKQNFSKNAVNRVMLVSDGDFNVGINNPEQLEDFVSRERESGVYLSILGFGGGNYNDLLLVWWLEHAAERGVHTTVLVQGDTLGGGLESVLPFHKVIFERSAQAGFPEVLFNLFPGMGAWPFTIRKAGFAVANDMILSGRLYTAEQLLRRSLVDVVVEDGEGEAAIWDRGARGRPAAARHAGGAARAAHGGADHLRVAAEHRRPVGRDRDDPDRPATCA